MVSFRYLERPILYHYQKGVYRMKKQKMIQARLECPECKTVMPISRKAGKKKVAGHIKHMYCPTCKEVRGFEELGNIDKQVSFWESYQEENSF